MAETIAPEYAQFVAEQRRAARLAEVMRPLAEGEVFKPVFVDAGKAPELLRVAARRAAGFFRPTKRTEVVWVEGDNELAVGLAGVDVKLGSGLIRVSIPVRCDEAGSATVVVLIATGAAGQPAGLYAAAPRRPQGPDVVVTAWGEALVAFAWQCVLGLVSGIAAATGKDARGNLLVPVEIEVSARGITIVPMARYHFAGSSTLKTSATTATKPPVKPPIKPPTWPPGAASVKRAIRR